MNIVKNIVIGMMMATLMLTMLASPAVAEVDNYGFAYPTMGSAGYIMDADDVTKLKYYEYPPPYTWYYGDVIQLIDVGPNGVIDPPDPNDPNYVGGDDVYNSWTDQDPPAQGHCIGEATEEDGTFYMWIYDPSATTIYWYVRAWNAGTIGEATHYGDSVIVECTGTGGNDFDFFPSGTWVADQPKPAMTKSVPMEVGWNGISLCYEPSSNATADVLSSIAGNYSAVKEWVPLSHDWADADTMDRGTGYFVYVTTACTWEHTGMSMTAPMEIPLETGLNFVGYPFGKTNSTSDALAGLNYYYAAPFDASTQKYEDTYNPAAPAPFNDFTTISPCEAFWVSSKDGVDWTAA